MHSNAFTNQGAKLFPSFSRFRGFYLVGGTALALQIGHRMSVDFDFFCEKLLPSDLLSKAKCVFADSRLSVTYRAVDQLNVLIDDVKVTFFHFEYPVIDPFIEYQRVPIASVREIAAMKAFSIGKRLSYKDYVDWYFLLKGGYLTLPEVIAHAKKKFAGDFNDRLFLGQLVSFEDIQTQKIDFFHNEVSRGAVEQYLKDSVRDIMEHF